VAITHRPCAFAVAWFLLQYGSPMTADFIFRGGRVFVPGEGPQELAVAVEGELISAVGPEREVMGLTSQGTEVIDIGSRLLCPGFIDAHVHPITGGLKRLRCDLAGCADASEALAAVASLVHKDLHDLGARHCASTLHHEEHRTLEE
jgi:predicted amidohydrolase YtcJ